MNSILTVAAPASNLNLLTIAELRAAVGVSDNSKDDALLTLGRRISDRITQACKVRADGAIPPTLREESLVETFRQHHLGFGYGHGYGVSVHHGGRHRALVLARRPIVAVASIVESDVTLDTTDYQINAANGMIERLRSGFASSWAAFGGTIVVSYTAGWAVVPESLKSAAEQLARGYWFQQSRDPALRQINIPGVVERSFWVGAASDPDVPQDVLDMLAPYMNMVIA